MEGKPEPLELNAYEFVLGNITIKQKISKFTNFGIHIVCMFS